jgi:signal recognition particle subunit SRP54
VLTELGNKIAGALRKIGEAPVIDEETLKELLKEVSRALLEADVRVGLVKGFGDRVRAKCNITELPPGVNRQKLIKSTVYQELVAMVNPGRKPYAMKRGKSSVIMFVGLQGAGKTTTVAKYALHYSRARYKTCMVCADTFRAGAFEQLKVCAC